MFDLSHPQHKEMLARLLEEANQHAIEHPSPTQKERDASFGENDRDVSAVDFRAHIEEVLRLSSSSSSSSFSSPSTARKSQSSSLSSSPSSTSSSSFSSSASSSSRSSSMEDDYSSSSASSSFAQDSHSTHDVDQSAFSDTGYYGDDNTHAHDTHESEVTIRDDDGYYQTTFDFETDKDNDQDNVRHDDDGRYAPSLSSPAPTSSSSYRSWDDVYASHRGDQDSLGSDSEYDVNVRTGTRSADVKTPRQQTSPKKYRSWDDIRNGAREGGLESGGEQRFDNNEYRLSGGRTF